MRLINTETKRLVELARPPSRYAILSHTWGEEEITFQDITVARPQLKRGYAKFQGAVRLAREAGYELISIDNCCIDKSSSAELSEAINSMFQWYRQATVCYVYFSDVSTGLDDTDLLEPSWFKELRISRWFRRSWTLQELLAPGQLEFFSREWVPMGTKHDLRWQGLLPELTGISHRVLFTTDGYNYASVAQKMSWAADREATRKEDIAYSLFGLFGVHMAPLYGEGGYSAFQRLQEEIVGKVVDETILAWNPLAYPSVLTRREQSGLAPSPACFRDKGDVINTPIHMNLEADPMSVTPKGLRMELRIIQTPGVRGAIVVISSKRAGPELHFLGVPLWLVKHHSDDKPWSDIFYTKDHTRDIAVVDPSAVFGLKSRRIFLVRTNSILSYDQQQRPTAYTAWISSLPSGFTVAVAHPLALWNPGLQAFRHGHGSFLGTRDRVLLLHDNNHQRARYYVVATTIYEDDRSITAAVALQPFLERSPAQDLIYTICSLGVYSVVGNKAAGKLDYSSCTFSHDPDDTWPNSSASSSASFDGDSFLVVKVQPEQELGELRFKLSMFMQDHREGLP